MLQAFFLSYGLGCLVCQDHSQVSITPFDFEEEKIKQFDKGTIFKIPAALKHTIIPQPFFTNGRTTFIAINQPDSFEFGAKTVWSD